MDERLHSSSTSGQSKLHRSRLMEQQSSSPRQRQTSPSQASTKSNCGSRNQTPWRTSCRRTKTDKSSSHQEIKARNARPQILAQPPQQGKVNVLHRRSAGNSDAGSSSCEDTDDAESDADGSTANNSESDSTDSDSDSESEAQPSASSAELRKPQKPLNSFACFIRAYGKTVEGQQESSEASGRSLKKMAAIWRNMSDDDKLVYRNEAQADAQRYENEKKNYELKKQSNDVKKPISGYSLYLQEFARDHGGDFDNGQELFKEGAKTWNALSAEDKDPWNKTSLEQSERYRKHKLRHSDEYVRTRYGKYDGRINYMKPYWYDPDNEEMTSPDECDSDDAEDEHAAWDWESDESMECTLGSSAYALTALTNLQGNIPGPGSVYGVSQGTDDTVIPCSAGHDIFTPKSEEPESMECTSDEVVMAPEVMAPNSSSEDDTASHLEETGVVPVDLTDTSSSTITTGDIGNEE